jgi:hypothetical protein
MGVLKREGAEGDIGTNDVMIVNVSFERFPWLDMMMVSVLGLDL